METEKAKSIILRDKNLTCKEATQETWDACDTLLKDLDLNTKNSIAISILFGNTIEVAMKEGLKK